MKKSLKIVLIIVGMLIIYVVLDLVSIYKKNKPLFYISEAHFIDNNDNTLWQRYDSLFYNIYNCSQYSSPQIKSKWSNYSCPYFRVQTDENDGGWYNNSYIVIGVSMTIKDDTLTNKGLTLIIKDSTDFKYTFSEEFYVVEEVEGVWKKVKEVHTDYGFNEPAYFAYDNELELKQDWEYMYGNLKKGTYRLVKKIFRTSDEPLTEQAQEYISVDFEIE